MEICCAVGLSALSKGQPDISLTWLERALHPSLWSELAVEQADLALKDMRFLSLHLFGTFLLKQSKLRSWCTNRPSSRTSPAKLNKLMEPCTRRTAFLTNCELIETLVVFQLTETGIQGHTARDYPPT